MQSLDLILTVGSLIVGLMMLTGHGDVFMKGGDAKLRKKKYDEKKMQKACGLAFILVGIVTAIDSQLPSFYAKIGYLVILIVIFVGLFVYLQKKCRIDK